MNCTRRSACFALLLIPALLLAIPTLAQWTTVTIDEPGRALLNGSPNGETILATSEYSGVWISRDGGLDWSPISAAVSNNDPLYERVDVFGANGDTIILSGEEDSPYTLTRWSALKMSTNGGSTWYNPLEQWDVPTLHPYGVLTFAIDEMVPTNWYISTSSWVGVSQDAGASWTYIDPEGTLFSAPQFACDPRNPSRIFAIDDIFSVDHSYGALYVTENGGESWTEIELGELEFRYINTLLVQPDGTVLLFGADSEQNFQVVRSTTNMAAWESFELGGLDLANYGVFVGHTFDTYTMLAFGNEYLPVMISTDSGESWQDAGFDFPATRGRFRDVKVNPSTGVIYGRTAIKGTFRIPATWNSIEWVDEPRTGGLINWVSSSAVNESGMLIATHEKRLFFAAGDETEFELIHPVIVGETYLNVNEILWFDDSFMMIDLYRVSEHDGERLSEQQLGLSFDHGQSWVYRTPPGDQTRACQTESGIELISQSYQAEHEWVSSDTGRTWSEADILPDNVYRWEMNGNVAVLSTHSFPDWVVYQSTDGGQNWTQADLGLEGYLGYWSSLAFIQLGIVADFMGNTFLFDEEGHATPLADLYQLPGISALEGVVTAEGDLDFYAAQHQVSKLYRLESFGTEWVEVDIENALGTQGTGIYGLLYDPYRNRLWMSNGEGLAWKEMSSNDVEPGMTDAPFTHDLLASWPNPFNAMTTVQITLAQPGQTTVSVYDLLGREVARLHEGHLSAGRHSMELDGSILTSGVYFLRLETASGVVNRRVTLLK